MARSRLEVNQIARIDFKMEVGELTQTVEVTGAAPILQTESTATGDAINAAKLTSMPAQRPQLRHRSPCSSRAPISHLARA